MGEDKYIDEWARDKINKTLNSEGWQDVPHAVWDTDDYGFVDDPSYNYQILFATKHNLVEIEMLMYADIAESICPLPDNKDLWDGIKARQDKLSYHLKNPKLLGSSEGSFWSDPKGGEGGDYGEDYSKAYLASKDLIKWLEHIRQNKGDEVYP